MSKIFIAIPSTEQVVAEFAQCLSMSTAYLVSQGHSVNVALNIGTYVAKNRRELVEFFLKTDFEYIWWLDYDHTFPIDACSKLLEHNTDIVGCNYRKRRFPNPIFIAHRSNDKNKSAIESSVSVELTDKSPPTEYVDIIGMGCCLVKRQVYEKIGEPYYIIDYDKKKKIEIGEDIYFCQKAKEKGYKILCDNELSKEISHVGIYHFRYKLEMK
jgi:hypothetical protein